MKSVLMVFFIFFFLLSICVFPFKIRAMGHFNILNLMGFYSLKIMFFRLLTGRFLFEDGKIVFQNSVNFMEDKFNKSFSKQFLAKVVKKMDIKKIEVYFTGGIVDNSFSSAIVCGSMSSIIQTFYSIVSQKYYKVKLYEDIDPTFNENNLEITFDAVISISLVALAVSIISAHNYMKKELKNERQ